MPRIYSVWTSHLHPVIEDCHRTNNNRFFETRGGRKDLVISMGKRLVPDQQSVVHGEAVRLEPTGKVSCSVSGESAGRMPVRFRDLIVS